MHSFLLRVTPPKSLQNVEYSLLLSQFDSQFIGVHFSLFICLIIIQNPIIAFSRSASPTKTRRPAPPPPSGTLAALNEQLYLRALSSPPRDSASPARASSPPSSPFSSPNNYPIFNDSNLQMDQFWEVLQRHVKEFTGLLTEQIYDNFSWPLLQELMKVSLYFTSLIN